MEGTHRGLALTDWSGIDAHPHLGTDRRYVLQERLGRGAAAAVYRAHDSLKGGNVAVKFIEVGNISETEERAIIQLEHPRLVGVTDAGMALGFRWFVMEYCPNASLREKIAAGPSPPLKALRWVFDALEALGYVHAYGLIHLNIWPGNLLLQHGDRVKLADVGLARHLESGYGRAYYAPERRSDQLSVAADLYSLGLTLQALVTGAEPSLQTVGKLHPAIRPVVLKATLPKPQSRQLDAREMAEEVALAADQIAAEQGLEAISRGWMRGFDTLLYEGDLTPLPAKPRWYQRLWGPSE